MPVLHHNNIVIISSSPESTQPDSIPPADAGTIVFTSIIGGFLVLAVVIAYIVKFVRYRKAKAKAADANIVEQIMPGVDVSRGVGSLSSTRHLTFPQSSTFEATRSPIARPSSVLDVSAPHRFQRSTSTMRSCSSITVSSISTPCPDHYNESLSQWTEEEEEEYYPVLVGAAARARESLVQEVYHIEFAGAAHDKEMNVQTEEDEEDEYYTEYAGAYCLKEKFAQREEEGTIYHAGEVHSMGTLVQEEDVYHSAFTSTVHPGDNLEQRDEDIYNIPFAGPNVLANWDPKLSPVRGRVISTFSTSPYRIRGGMSSSPTCIPSPSTDGSEERPSSATNSTTTSLKKLDNHPSYGCASVGLGYTFPPGLTSSRSSYASSPPPSSTPPPSSSRSATPSTASNHSSKNFVPLAVPYFSPFSIPFPSCALSTPPLPTPPRIQRRTPVKPKSTAKKLYFDSVSKSRLIVSGGSGIKERKGITSTPTSAMKLDLPPRAAVGLGYNFPAGDESKCSSLILSLAPSLSTLPGKLPISSSRSAMPSPASDYGSKNFPASSLSTPPLSTPPRIQPRTPVKPKSTGKKPAFHSLPRLAISTRRGLQSTTTSPTKLKKSSNPNFTPLPLPIPPSAIVTPPLSTPLRMQPRIPVKPKLTAKRASYDSLSRLVVSASRGSGERRGVPSPSTTNCSSDKNLAPLPLPVPPSVLVTPPLSTPPRIQPRTPVKPRSTTKKPVFHSLPRLVVSTSRSSGRRDSRFSSAELFGKGIVVR